MNALFAEFGLLSWKSVLGALALPPLPLLLLMLVGARVLLARRALGWFLLLLGAVGIWLTACVGFGEWLMRATLRPPPVLDLRAQADLRREVTHKQPVAIVVLGAGREARAPEYGVSNLTALSIERLRYGVWLGRETGAPVAFSGGVGHAASDGPSEAEIAARIAAREFGRPLRWIEGESRDTRENAGRTVALLKADGVARIVIVTHAWHMPRARRAFEEAARHAGLKVAVTPAPIAWAPRAEGPLRWLPSVQGFSIVRYTLHEGLGMLMGA